MIRAARSPWFGAWFARDAERRIARRFDRVLVRGLDVVERACGAAPVLVVSNHTAWWDPLVSLHLFWRVLPVEGYAMMDAKNLRAFPFFRRVGAFGVDMSDPHDGARAVRYAAGLLDAPGRLVWIFAQGREVPITARPLGFRPGAALIARLAPRAVVLPCAIRYELGARPDPDLYVSFGAAMNVPRTVDAGARALEAAVVSELDRVDGAILAADAADFTVLHRKKESALFALAQRALAWLTRLPDD